MHIDKYLCDYETPDFQPGPFSGRLKYELRQSFFTKRNLSSLHIAYTSALLCLLLLCSVFVLNPQVAQSLNYYVFGNLNDDSQDVLLLPERDIDLSQYPSNIRTVSTTSNQSLPFIEEDKSYIIHKFRNCDNKTLYYISEIKESPRPAALHI